MNTIKLTNTMIKLEKRHPILIDLVILLSLWVIAVMLVNPIGNFPLNDDWVYGESVRNLIENHTLKIHGYSSSILITQVLWGGLFCLPFGFSFNLLRFSTLVLGIAGSIGTYCLLVQLKSSHRVALIGALALAFNPVYFTLSFTFMTDVPFTALTVLALLFLVRGLQVESDKYLFFGLFFAIAASLCRQIGLFIPVAFVIAFLIKNGISSRTLIKSLGPLFLAVGVVFIFDRWIRLTNDNKTLTSRNLFTMFEVLTDPTILILNLKRRSEVAIIYFGIFLIPFILLFKNPLSTLKNRVNILGNIIICTIILLYISVSMLLNNKLMPLEGSTLGTGGVGLITLHDVYLMRLPHFNSLPKPFWEIITIISILSGGLFLSFILSLVQNLFSSFSKVDGNNRVLIIFLLSGFFIYCFPIFVTNFYDRYLIPLLPMLFGLYSLTNQTNKRPIFTMVAQVLICLYLLYSIAATKDYIEWNRVRWQALQQLTAEESISPKQIDGGYEFNGWYLYSADYQSSEPKSWWWVYDDNYMITMGPVPGFEEIRKYDYYRWLPPQKASIFVLRRQQTQ